MKITKKIILIILILLVLILLAGWLYYISLKPSYSGTLKLNNLQNETTVYFDDYGIPHIYAKNETDAITALGYVHAKERLWQMELLRRIAPGKLSELFGEQMLETDKFFVNLGIEEHSIKTIEKINKNKASYKLATAYVNGINQFIEKGKTPIEFQLIGIKKEPFQLKDVYNILGYMSFSFAQAQKTDPLLTAISNKLDSTYLNELNIDSKPNTTLIKNSKKDIETFESMVNQIHEVMQKTPVSPFIGSNSWVVSKNKTSTGNVLFANDPHIGYSQPAVWYEAHLNTPTYEMYGYFLAGVPFPLLGHNHQYAYGLTMFENDDIDFYKETLHPTDSLQYVTPNGYEAFEKSEKSINIKDKNPVTITIKKTRHGPIINSVIDNISTNEPIAMWWMYTQFTNDVLNALYTISHATKMEDVKKGASMIHAPGLNIMYGDAKGNIAWWASAKLFKNNANVNRKFILNGSSGNDDPVTYLNFSENPMAENPSWQYVYSSNNQPDSIANILYPGYYLPEDRAKRIVSLLEAKNNWSKTDFKEMITDNISSTASINIQILANEIQHNNLTELQQKALQTLLKWDGSSSTESIATTIYSKWIYNFLKFTFEDELEESLFENLLKTHLIKRVISFQLNKQTSVWWDNVKTTEKTENRHEILLNSFTESINSLENQLGNDMLKWNWGKIHTLEHPHPLGTVASLKSIFNVGPFPASGTTGVIDNKNYEFTDSGFYPVTSGPSTRRIIDFSDVENSVSILPTGQSGNPFSKFYKDQAEMYNKGMFRKMKLNKEEIISVSTKLTLLPTNE